VRTFQCTSDGERRYGAMATSTKTKKMSVVATEDTYKGIGQFGINTEIDPTTR
jgi:hypothetical protein